MSPQTSKASAVSSEPVMESLLSRYFAVPVLFVSFIISLFLIDRSTSAGVFSHEDPKADPDKRYYRSNHRKLAKQEFNEAFALRKRVIAGICITSAVALATTVWCMSKAWAYFVTV